MTDFSHLHALETRLAHERARLERATKASEIAMRKVWVSQIEREISGERLRLGIGDAADIGDDDLLAELFGQGHNRV